MLETIIADLREKQRRRSVLIKSRIMIANRLQSIVAVNEGYSPELEDKTGMEIWKRAGQIVAHVVTGEDTHELSGIILAHHAGIKELEKIESGFKRDMEKLAKHLPVATWMEQPQQRGFGYLMLAQVIGECGDLANYANPAKLWKRMGCAPHSFDGETKMGATWKSGREGKLPAEEWVKYGYCPRRRSIAYLFGEGIVKQNKSIYRARYDEAKASGKANHPDWSDKRAHLHGMLLATKMLLRNLWCEWNHKPADQTFVTEKEHIPA